VRDDPFQAGLAFGALGDHIRENYLQFEYTRGTRQEAAFLTQALDLPTEARVLDLACGLGRHEALLPWQVVGADLSRGLLEVAAQGGLSRAAWLQAEARHLPLASASLDGAFSVCEGAFGLLPDDAAHEHLLAEVRRVVRPGAPFLLSAMSVFAMCDDDAFDPLTNTMSDHYDLPAPGGGPIRTFRLTTRAFAPREVIAMAQRTGWQVEAVWGGISGAYEMRPLHVRDAEMLVMLRADRA